MSLVSFNLSPHVNELLACVCVGLKRWPVFQCCCFTCFAWSQAGGSRFGTGPGVYPFYVTEGGSRSCGFFGTRMWEELRHACVPLRDPGLKIIF